MVFKPEVRDTLIVKDPKDRQFFTVKQCELINGLPRKEGDQDELEGRFNYISRRRSVLE